MSSLPSTPDDPCYVDTVLGSVVQPLLQSCRMGAQSLQPGDMAIFMLNNVSVIQHELKDGSNRASHSDRVKISQNWFDLLDTETSTWIDVLVNEEVQRTLRRSDMDKLLELVEFLPSGIMASQQPGLTQDRIGTIMRAFYASLFTTITPHYERLQEPTLREKTRKGTAEAVSKAHEKVSS